MLKIKLIIASLVLGLLFFACEDRTELTAPTAPSTGQANFSKFISLGNSLTAGYQSGALYEDAQMYSFGKMIANQVNVDYVQPIISNPGIGGRIEVKSVSPFATTTQPEDAGQPTNLGYAGIYNNLGIPGALLPDLLQATSKETSISGNNVFFDIVLRGQGTVLDQALAFQPTIATLWIGNNDILGYATSGGTLPHTPEAVFGQLYNMLAGGLAQAGIPTVLANIPNVKAIPFFTTVAPSVGLAIQAAQQANPQIAGLVYQKTEDPFIGVAPVENLLNNDVLITLKGATAAAFIGDTEGKYYAATNTPVPDGVITAYPFGLTPENPFPNQFVLDPDEQSVVETVTASFNSTIAAAATTFGFALVDVNSFFNTVASSGFVANGVTYTAEYVSGGLFSLDGVHPTSQGYAVIANEFIKVINEKFVASIPQINVTTIPGSLELAKKVSFNKYGLPIFEPGTFDRIFY